LTVILTTREGRINTRSKQDLDGGSMKLESELICEKAYGCINVKAGEEKKVAKMIQTAFPGVEAHSIMKMKHRRSKGVRSYSSEIMVPGYILFSAFKDMQVSQFLSITSVNRILTYEDHDWHLRGDDQFFSNWIFNNNGMIGISVVFMEGDEIKIIDGPLKQIEGKIIRINKRCQNALVVLGLKQQTFNVWLPFEWMKKTTDLD
jgi:transcription termination/antitermination protein NusG